MRLGIHENPLVVHVPPSDTRTKVVGTDINVSSLVDPSEDAPFQWVQVDRPGAEAYVRGYVTFYADMGVRFLRIDFLSWYEDGFDHFPPEVASLGRGAGRVAFTNGQRAIDAGGDGIRVVPRRIGPYDVLHLVNLVGQGDRWRNAASPPPVQTDLGVRYYLDDGRPVAGVHLASPDVAAGATAMLPFAEGEDARGRYVEFRVPRLEYWDVVYVRRER